MCITGDMVDLNFLITVVNHPFFTGKEPVFRTEFNGPVISRQWMKIWLSTSLMNLNNKFSDDQNE